MLAYINIDSFEVELEHSIAPDLADRPLVISHGDRSRSVVRCCSADLGVLGVSAGDRVSDIQRNFPHAYKSAAVRGAMLSWLWLLVCVIAFSFGHGGAVAGGLDSPTNEVSPHTSDEMTTIGHLAWEITEPSTGKVLGQGSRPVRMREVQVIARKGSGYLEQRIPLSAGFYLKLNSGRKEEPFMGFGMAAGKEDQHTFSWEWFTVKESTRAQKLQENGLLEIRMEKIGQNYEILRTHFLSDVSMRVIDWEKEGVSPTPKDPAWRVKILKHSDIEWPTFAGGKVRSPAEATAWYAANPPPPGFWSSLFKVASERTKTTNE